MISCAVLDGWALVSQVGFALLQPYLFEPTRVKSCAIIGVGFDSHWIRRYCNLAQCSRLAKGYARVPAEWGSRPLLEPPGDPCDTRAKPRKDIIGTPAFSPGWYWDSCWRSGTFLHHLVVVMGQLHFDRRGNAFSERGPCDEGTNLFLPRAPSRIKIFVSRINSRPPAYFTAFIVHTLHL